MSSLHQGSLLTKPRCKPFPDAPPVSDCAVCPSHSQGRGVSLQSGFTPPRRSACCHQSWSLPFQIFMSVFLSLWEWMRFSVHFVPTCGSHSVYNSPLVYKASSRFSWMKIGFTSAKVWYWNIFFLLRFRPWISSSRLISFFVLTFNRLSACWFGCHGFLSLYYSNCLFIRCCPLFPYSDNLTIFPLASLVASGLTEAWTSFQAYFHYQF